MFQSESINGLLKSVCEAQAELPTMPKDTKGYSYMYTNLDTIVATIKPILAKYGLGYIQPITTTANGRMAITTRLFNKDGEYVEDTAVLPDVTLGKTNAAQNLGAAITYMRRYALCSMLGITSDEDVDGNVQTHQGMQQQNTTNAPQKTKGAQQKRQNGPVGGPDTPAQANLIMELLAATDTNGNKLFNDNDVKTVEKMRMAKPADVVIQELKAEMNKRLAQGASASAEEVQENVVF